MTRTFYPGGLLPLFGAFRTGTGIWHNLRIGRLRRGPRPKKPELVFRTLRPAYGVWGKWHLSPHWALRLTAQSVTLAGSDALSQRPRGLHFQTSMTEYSLSGEWRLLAFAAGKGAVEGIPYLHFGAGRIRFMPQAKTDGRWIDLQPLGTEGQGIKGYPFPTPPAPPSFLMARGYSF
ncbi:MAG: hypothetical protein IPK21_04450 [Haliscomenobacter sp.]|nr:hypothetical protein [Haliscomenobacter sp.]